MAPPKRQRISAQEKLTLKSLQPSELSNEVQFALWAAVVESSDDAIVCKTLDGRICAWNKGAERLFGYAADEIIGRSIATLIPSELQIEADDFLSRLKRGERIDHFETVRLNKDGRRIEVSITISPVRDETGRVIAASKIAREIGERRQAERVRAQLAAIVDSCDDAIISKSLDSVIQSWNEGATRIFGYTPEEAIGRSVLMLIPAELMHEEDLILRHIRQGKRFEHFDTVRLAKNGRRVPISLTVSPVRDADGTVIGASKIARDISERLHAADILATEAAALATLNDFSSSLWQCRHLNEGLKEILNAVIALLGADKGAIQLLDPVTGALDIVVNQGFDTALLDRYQESTADRTSASRRAVQTGERIIIEDTDTDKSYASLRSIAHEAGYRAVVSTPLVNSSREPIGVVSTYYAEPHLPSPQALRRLDLYCRQASDFMQRCQIEERLRDGERALKEADRRKDEFLALLAHELRNPLAPVRYAVAIAQKSGSTAAQRQQANEIISRQVAHMSRLLDDLLDVSRITRGKLELKKSSAELTSILGAAIEAARPLLDSKRHSLELELPSEAIRLHADTVRLTQVFSNLLINAAKYTNPGGRILLRAHIEHGEIVIHVKDTGIGITEDLLPRLFTIFTQADNAIERSEGGLGVGLSIVKGLVNLHGGIVHVRSAGQDQGSEFVVRLPVISESQSIEHAAPASTPQSEVGLRVLIVDDNMDSAQSCKTLLELWGHDVQLAHTGKSGFVLGEQHQAHILLLDIGLPDTSGYDLAERIRATSWGREATLVAITGRGKEDDRQSALKSGFDYHLTKPVAPQTLETLIGSLRSDSALE